MSGHNPYELISHYNQALKTTIAACSYLYKPNSSVTKTITISFVQDVISGIQLHAHNYFKHKVIRHIVGYLFGLFSCICIIVFCIPSCVELTIASIYVIFQPRAAVRAGLIGFYVPKHRRYGLPEEWIVLNVIDSKIAEEIRSVTCVKDPLGVRYTFPEHVPASSINDISRCWRMVNDFRIRIVRHKHSLHAVPVGNMIPLSVEGMCLYGRPEIQRFPERKLVHPCIRLLEKPASQPDNKECTKICFEFSIKANLHEQMCFEFMRTQLVRDAEERYLGTNPRNNGEMINFLKSYVRVSLCLCVFLGGLVCFADSPLLERSAFALTFGLFAAERWESSMGGSTTYAVGESSDSMWRKDRDRWRRFFERRQTGSTDMSEKNGCWLRIRGRGKHDLCPVRVNELAILHDVFVGDEWAFMREGCKSFVARVDWQRGNGLCLGSWIAVEKKCIEDGDGYFESMWCEKVQKGTAVPLADAHLEVMCSDSKE